MEQKSLETIKTEKGNKEGFHDMNLKKPELKILVLLLALVPLFFLQDLYIHFTGHFTGSVTAITQEWTVVLVNIVFFMLFLIPLTFRRKANWKEKGLVSAFFISLFVEMYGIPFSMMFVSNYLGITTEIPKTITTIQVYGIGFGMTIGMFYGTILMLIGMTLIVIGWITLYNSIKKQEIVTTGIYSRSRHPQYLGFVLVTAGWFAGWPTLLTTILAPILVYKYVTLCREEEKEAMKTNPEYKEYMKSTPFLV